MSRKYTSPPGYRGRHAVVIGASMAGLLASRVLADHFEQVTLIERDRLPQQIQTRKGVPQGQHLHLLLQRGASLLQELFPNLFPALLQEGTVPIDTTAEAYWYSFGSWKARFTSGITFYCQSRPLLEGQVRAQLLRRSNVHLLDSCEVVKLCATADAARITGVQIRHRDGEQREAFLYADLVMDASGRGSHTPQWLAALGYDQVEETMITVDVGYATRLYQRPEHSRFDRSILAIYSTPPIHKRLGALAPIEENRWIVTLVGWARDYPPHDEAGFLAFARSLPQPDLYEAIKDAQPASPIATLRFPVNHRRHYERLSRFPEGLVVLGDAVCSFNPIYAQGMTVAALEADLLSSCLSEHQRTYPPGELTGFSRRFQKKIAPIVNTFWLITASEDFRLPETRGRRPPFVGLLNSYSRRIQELSACDPQVMRLFFEVQHALKGPLALFSPTIVAKVLFTSPSRRRDQEGTDTSPDA